MLIPEETELAEEFHLREDMQNAGIPAEVMAELEERSIKPPPPTEPR